MSIQQFQRINKPKEQKKKYETAYYNLISKIMKPDVNTTLTDDNLLETLKKQFLSSKKQFDLHQINKGMKRSFLSYEISLSDIVEQNFL